jgi:hypothetical protein
LFKQQLGSPTVTDRLVGILMQELAQTLNKGTQLGMGLGDPLILLVGYATSNDISDCVAGKVHLAGYRSNCFPFSKISMSDFSDGLHVQHLLSFLLSLMNFQRVWSRG